MKHITLSLLLLQIYLFAITGAQITFTREWVTGKRSAPMLKYIKHEDKKELCKTFAATMDNLFQMAKIHQQVCGLEVRERPLFKKSTSFSLLNEDRKSDSVFDDDNPKAFSYADKRMDTTT